MTSAEEIRSRLRALQAGDPTVRVGRSLAYAFDSGLPGVDEIGREAVAALAGTGRGDPLAFPRLLQMENELVGFAAQLLDGPPGVVGTVTSGGTESALLAVQAARDSRPEVERPTMVIPSTAHAAFDKAAHYFRVEAVEIPVGPDFRADPTAMAAMIDGSTVLVVASAPSYAHGVVDPVAEIGAAAAARDVRCHVDAGMGGWVLPFAERLGRRTPPWGFAVEGVTSISVDLDAYAYAPKGASILLHRSAALRRPQLFASAAWPGYPLVSSTMSASSGGALAGAWAVVQMLGEEGYLGLTVEALEAVDRIVAGVVGIDGIDVVAQPDSTLVTLATDQTCDPFTVCDEMAARGWRVQPQLSYAGHGPTLHLTVSAGTLPHVDELLYSLRLAVMAAQAVGPVTVSPTLAGLVESLNLDGVTDAVVDRLVGELVGDWANGLPVRQAELNAVLDLASTGLREALMAAIRDRMSRPASTS